MKSSKPQPSEQALANRIKLLFPQYAELADCPNDGISCHTLHHESTGFQESDWNSDFEFRPTQTGRMWHNRNQRSITIPITGTHGRTFSTMPGPTAKPHREGASFSPASSVLKISSAACAVSSSSSGPESNGIARRKNSAVKARFSSLGNASNASGNWLVWRLIP
jgi:hypothetical protein